MPCQSWVPEAVVDGRPHTLLRTRLRRPLVPPPGLVGVRGLRRPAPECLHLGLQPTLGGLQLGEGVAYRGQLGGDLALAEKSPADVHQASPTPPPALGAAGAGAMAEKVHESTEGAALSMDAYQFRQAA